MVSAEEAVENFFRAKFLTFIPIIKIALRAKTYPKLKSEYMIKLSTRLFVFGLALIASSFVKAQEVGDTIVVNTFDYNSLTRDTVIDFPDFTGLTFEKVLMTYNMRCHGAAVNGGGGNNNGPNGPNACGEWDYSCNTYLHDESKTDSVKASHPNYTISAYGETTYPYTTSPTYTYYQSTQEEVVISDVISEVVSVIGDGDVPTEYPFENESTHAKTQYLITATELQSGGIVAGDITGIAVDVESPGNTVNNLRIRVKHTAQTELVAIAPELEGFETVYYLTTDFDNTGMHQFNFSSPFNWDGASNLIVEFTYLNTDGSGSDLFSTSATGMGISSAATDYSIEFNGSEYIAVDEPMENISNQITISFWAYGNPDILPANTSAIEGVGPNNERQVNIHLPWENGRVYWDCGNEGGYDRIDKAATAEEIGGKWNHWAFTKNANLGIMKIFLNGEIWHSGSGMNNLIDLDAINIGANINGGNGYVGNLDEVRIWKAELSSSRIREYMYRSVDSDHPNYEHLVAYYKFDEGAGQNVADELGNYSSAVSTNPTWRQKKGNEVMTNFEDLSERPNFQVVQGTYDSEILTSIVLDSLVNGANTVIEYAVDGTDLIEVSTNLYYLAGEMPIWDEDGNQVGSVNVPAENTIEVVDLDYYQKSISKIELMSFVTPYGIGLNMTPTGRTWTFDMTDFTPVLNGSKRITVEGAGQWQEEMDIKFHFIVGTPPRDVLELDQIWRVESRNYSVIGQDQYFEPRDYATRADGDAFKVKSAITGHGQEGEFIPRTHWVDVNGGSNEFSWQVWKECAANPLFPQGGTWVYDRAGWCPGMATDVQEWDITQYVTPGETVNLDYGVTGATGDSRYIVNHQIVTYGEANFTNDARVVEVRKPSDRFEYDRIGTICHSPEVVIQNSGSNTLTSLTINYWVNGAPEPESYTWEGSLEMMETELVVLPTPESLWNAVTETDNVFYVEIADPNGSADEYEQNNSYASHFNIPPVLPNHFLIMFNTNNVPSENSFELRDANENILFERDGMSANTLYRDTLLLDAGCYTFEVFDTGDDGLSWWANNDGSGYARLKEVGGPTIEFFESDYGDGIIYQFSIDQPLSYADVSAEHQFEVFPNPTSDLASVRLSGFDTEVTITVFNGLGQAVIQKRVQQIGTELIEEIDLNKLESGVYLIQVNDGQRAATQKLVKE